MCKWNSIAWSAALTAVSAIVSGCHHSPPKAPVVPPPLTGQPTFSQYHQETFTWSSVARVVVLPLLNESKYTRAGDEVGVSLRSELQSLARFEVVAAPPDTLARISAAIHRSGQFNEALMLDIVRDTHADIILHGTITDYSPYPRPRLGMVLQAVSPQDLKVVASIDGMWDSTRLDVADRIRTYYKIRPHTHPWIVNHTIWEDDSYSGEMSLDSPHLFQRFVCAEAVLNLVKDASAISAAFGECRSCNGGALQSTSRWLISTVPVSNTPRNFPSW